MSDYVLYTLIAVSIFLSSFLGLWFYQKITRSDNTKNAEIYADYLSSKKWEKLRKTALERADYKCELCNSPYEAVHHIKYPKRYKNDHVDNLLVVCDRCHARLHGIRDNDKIAEKITSKNTIGYVEEVKAGSRLYSFQVSSDYKKHLSIIESGKRGERQITVIEDNFEDFFQHLKAGLISLNTKSPAQFDEKIIANDLIYFFEVKFAVNDSKYLKVTESRKNNTIFEKNQILIFEDEAKLFLMGLNNVMTYLFR